MRNEVEMMRVVRVPPMGKLVVLVGDRRLENLTEVQNEALKRRLLTAIGELIGFAGGYEELVDAGVAPPLQASAPSPKKEEEPLTPAQAAFLESLEQQMRASDQPVPPGPSQIDLDVQFEETGQTTAPSSVNLVEEIDAILQEHVSANPVLAGRSVHLHQRPGGVLQIEVDGTRYEHPSDIEDKEVRVTLKRALKEWEMR